MNIKESIMMNCLYSVIHRILMSKTSTAIYIIWIKQVMRTVYQFCIQLIVHTMPLYQKSNKKIQVFSYKFYTNKVCFSLIQVITCQMQCLTYLTLLMRLMTCHEQRAVAATELVLPHEHRSFEWECHRIFVKQFTFCFPLSNTWRATAQ